MVVTVVNIVMVFLTIMLLAAILSPLESSSYAFGGGLEATFRLAYLIPLLALWLIYFAVRFFVGV